MTHTATDNIRIRMLLDEIDTLKEANRQLKQQLGPSWAPPLEWGLTRAESRMVSALMSRGTCTLDTLIEAVDEGSESCSSESVRVHMHRARKKLKPLGIHVQSVYGVGYSIDRATRERVLKETGK